MIPSSFTRRLSPPSPEQSVRDLALMINRTVDLAIAAKRQLGFAAVNIGCDGVKRTTLFDGSACQVDGDVCIASREDGITACIDAPSQGSGLVFQSITFSGPACVPVTGWWIVDSEGYLYRVPQSLIDAAAYWPMIADPVVPASVVTLTRTKTWAVLMCAAPLTIPLNGDGGSIWTVNGEGDWTQSFAAIIGGQPDSWLDEFGDPIVGIGLLPKPGFVIDAPSWRGVLLRDARAPNAGSRLAAVTLPTAETGVVTGAVRVAYGYPFGYRISEPGLGGTTTSKPYPRSHVPEGTWQMECAGRVVGDMALCYSRRLAIEYSAGHINLDGAAITDPNDYVSLDEIDQTDGPALDVHADLLALPDGEVALMGTVTGDLRSGLRYRVRPAPDTAPTVEIVQQAKGAWGDDPNLWTDETTYGVDPWLENATTFAVVGDMTAAETPGRAVPVILWETDDSSDTYLTAPQTYAGMLGSTTGGLTSIAFDFGVSVVASTRTYRYLTVLGTSGYAAWGWTFEVGGIESALSPLWDNGVYGYDLNPPSVLYSAQVTVPGGPTGTTVRRVYRMAWDYGSTPTLTGVMATGPWAYAANVGGGIGGLYDRHCRLVKTLTASLAEPGTDPVTFFDEDLSLSLAGTRPPSPLVYLGPIALDAPRPVHLLQPLNL